MVVYYFLAGADGDTEGEFSRFVRPKDQSLPAHLAIYQAGAGRAAAGNVRAVRRDRVGNYQAGCLLAPIGDANCIEQFIADRDWIW